MTDRISAGYEPNWDLDLAFGEQGQLIVLDMIKAIANGTIRCEVKRDRRFQDTGRLYIEHYQDRRNTGIWKPSGLLHLPGSQAWAFLVNNGQGLFIVDTPWLKRAVAMAAEYQGNHVEERDGDNPTRGIAIHLTHLEKTRRSR
jgi:hypothetical protein